MRFSIRCSSAHRPVTSLVARRSTRRGSSIRRCRLRRLACVGADGRGGLPLRRGPRGPRARPLASGIALEALSHDVGKRQAPAGECCQGCPICGRARARGLARWREWCYVSMLAPRLRSQFAQRNYLGAARQALSALATIPSLCCSCSDWPGPEAMLSVAPASPSEQHRDRAGVGTGRAGAGMTAKRGPDFFLIGAQRAGTTRLCGLLTLHPRISMPVKEPAFFEDARC